MKSDAQQDLNYIQHLVQSKGAGLKGIERYTFLQFEEVKKKVDEAKKRLQEIETEKKALINVLNENLGKMEAFGDVLLQTRKKE